MAKNDWTNDEKGLRYKMNQPFWLASGVKNGVNLEVSLSPGSIRYPFQSALTASGQPQLLTFANPKANERYHFFMRCDGSVVNSGTSTRTVPHPPKWDAEYLGMIHVNGAFETANLIGPWTDVEFGGYEQRGQLSSPGRLRTVYKRKTDKSPKQIATGANSLTNASGIAWVTMNDSRVGEFNPVNGDTHPGSVLYGEVEWMASGVKAGAAAFRQSVGFAMMEQSKLGSDSTTIGRTIDSVISSENLDPHNDAVVIGRTTTMVDVANINVAADGYVLAAWRDATSDANSIFLIKRVYFTVLPGGMTTQDRET